ncbi:hypothetical protein KUCAC02_013345 [Chaenocephalus aceratus]|nr:hypothetical protein KUCAC02_013345 [Chaenocephalus aceratus]
MAAVRLAPVQAMFMSVVLLSALYVCKVPCVIQYTRWDLLNFRHNQHAVFGVINVFPEGNITCFTWPPNAMAANRQREQALRCPIAVQEAPIPTPTPCPSAVKCKISEAQDG